jgi:hypothetical protein
MARRRGIRKSKQMEGTNASISEENIVIEVEDR